MGRPPFYCFGTTIAMRYRHLEKRCCFIAWKFGKRPGINPLILQTFPFGGQMGAFTIFYLGVNG